MNNCYVPLLHPSIQQPPAATKNDDKPPLQLRPLRLETGLNHNADGSSLVSWGRSLLLAKVQGPLPPDELPPGVMNIPEAGLLHCTVQSASSSTIDNNHSQQQVTPLDAAAAAHLQNNTTHHTRQRQIDLQTQLYEALQPAVVLVPHAAVHVHVTVLQHDDETSLLPASCLAATLALQDARWEMVDCVVATTVGESHDGSLRFVDPSNSNCCRSTITLAFLPNWQHVTFWEQKGKMEKVNECLELCQQGNRTIHRFVREHWARKLKESAEGTGSEGQGGTGSDGPKSDGPE